MIDYTSSRKVVFTDHALKRIDERIEEYAINYKKVDKEELIQRIIEDALSINGIIIKCRRFLKNKNPRIQYIVKDDPKSELRFIITVKGISHFSTDKKTVNETSYHSSKEHKAILEQRYNKDYKKKKKQLRDYDYYE